MTGSGKPFPGNDRNVFILAKAAPVWGCLGNPLPETVFAVNRPEAIKTPRIPPIPLFLGSSEGLKHAGDAVVSPQIAAAWHVLGSLGATGEGEGSPGSCSGPGKCLSLLRFRDRGLEEFQWFFFFPAGKKSRQRSPACWRANVAGLGQPGAQGQARCSMPSPALAGFLAPLGNKIMMGSPAAKNGLFCIACLFYHEELNAGTRNGLWG